MNRTQASINAADISPLGAVAFTKMQALGNDFVFVAESDLTATTTGKLIVRDLSKQGALLARSVCDRHFGIGADGLIIVRKPTRNDCQVSWLYFNSDGSISSMCGNGLRCLGLYAVHHQLTTGSSFNIETAVGPVPVVVVDASTITSDLGEPILEADKVPVAGKGREKIVKQPIVVDGQQLTATCLSMGNPHCVLFDTRLSEPQWRLLAPQIQQLELFPEGVNVEFVEVATRARARVFVWERGCGPTLACASGAAAVLVAGALEGRLDRSAVIELPGGSLLIHWDEKDNHVRISGSAKFAFSGTFDVDAYWPGDAA
jgi:diaminopimelate epimerase